MNKPKIIVIEVNGHTYYYGRDYDDLRVYLPNGNEPFWRIELLQGKKLTKVILATGTVTLIGEEVKGNE